MSFISVMMVERPVRTQGMAHLVGDLLERVADHLHGDDIAESTVHSGPAHNFTNSPRSGATSAAVPGGMSVAEVSSSTIAGRFIRIPGCKRSRRNTAVSR